MTDQIWSLEQYRALKTLRRRVLIPEYMTHRTLVDFKPLTKQELAKQIGVDAQKIGCHSLRFEDFIFRQWLSGANWGYYMEACWRPLLSNKAEIRGGERDGQIWELSYAGAPIEFHSIQPIEWGNTDAVLNTKVITLWPTAFNATQLHYVYDVPDQDNEKILKEANTKS